MRLDDLMLFLILFLSSKAYVRNNFIRAKLSEVIHAWLPEKETGRPSTASRSALLRDFEELSVHSVASVAA